MATDYERGYAQFAQMVGEWNMKLDPDGVEFRTLCEFGDLRDASVLEIGSGDGRLVRQYAPFASTVIGIDTKFSQVAEALPVRRAMPAESTHFVVAMAEALPFAGEVFDGAILAWSL